MMSEHRQPFADAMTILAEALDTELSDRRMETYWTVLKRYDWPMVERALRMALERKWFKFPQIGELIELIDGSPDDRAQVAWIGAWNAVEQIGRYRSIRCEDPLVAETIRLVFRSWPDFCNLAREGVEHNVKHREFLDTYRVLAKRGVGEVSDYLVGVFEVENARLTAVMDHGALPEQHPVGLIALDGTVETIYEPQPSELKPLTASATDTIALEATTDDNERQAPLALPSVPETEAEKAERLKRLRAQIARDVRDPNPSITDDRLRALRDMTESTDEEDDDA